MAYSSKRDEWAPRKGGWSIVTLENNKVHLRVNQMLVTTEVASQIRDILQEGMKAAAAEASRDRVLNLPQFAALCGLSPETIRRYVKDGRLKPISPTGRNQFLARQIDEFSTAAYPGAKGRLRIPRASDGLSASVFMQNLQRARRVRALQSLKAPDRKDPWHR